MWKLANKHASKVVTFALIAGLLIFFAYTIWIWPTLQPGDKGTWSGALGTVGTLIGTIWLATSESRRRHRDEITRARLHAASFMLQLAHASGALGQVTRSLQIDTQVDRGPGPILACLTNMQGIELWTIEDLIPLAPLSKNFAALLAESADQIKSFTKILEMAGRDASLSTSEKRKIFAEKAVHLMSGTASHLDVAIQQCDAARTAIHLSGD
jgi:hypothetical protein